MALSKKTTGSSETDGPVAFVGGKELTSQSAKSLASRKVLDRIQMTRIPTAREVDRLRRILEAHPETKLRLYALHGLTDVDLTPLSKLPELERLSVEHDLTDLTFLEGMQGLVFLSLTIKGKRTDLSALADCPNLRFLNLGGALKSLEPIANIDSLRWLSVEDKGTLDLSPLSRLPALASLGVGAAAVSSFDPLVEMKHLKQLSLSVRKASSDDMKPIARTSLEALGLGYMPRVTDLDFLAGAKRLGALSLLKLGGLESIAQLPKLRLWTLAFSVVGRLDEQAIDHLAACDTIECAVLAPKLFTELGREDAYEELQAGWRRAGLNWQSWRALVAERIGLEPVPA